MRRTFLCAVLVGVLIPALTAKDRLPRVFNSVMALQWLDEMGVARNHCTTWSVDNRGWWITAGHCAIKPNENDEEGGYIPALDRSYIIAGKPARIAVIDLTHDLAFFQGAEAEALPVSTRDVRVGDEISIPGYPLGESRPTIFYGHVAAVIVDGNWMGLDVTACRGNSGSPVLDKHGAVVSVLQVGTGELCSTYDGGVRQDALRVFVSKYGLKIVTNDPPFIHRLFGWPQVE